MEKFVVILMLNMLWIGPVQLISAVIGADKCEDAFRRNHYETYLKGVIVYFVVNVILLAFCQENGAYLLLRWTFFGGAFLLFLYHIAIVTGFLGSIFLRKRSL